jgi:hypothetical protein
MKKLFVLIALVGIAGFSLTSCGSKKEEKKEEADAYSDYEKAEPKAATPEDQIAQPTRSLVLLIPM